MRLAVIFLLILSIVLMGCLEAYQAEAPEQCEELESVSERNLCYMQLTARLADLGLCDKMQEEDGQPDNHAILKCYTSRWYGNQDEACNGISRLCETNGYDVACKFYEDTC